MIPGAAEGCLRDLGVPPDDVACLPHLEQYQFVFDQETVVGYEAWADLKSCTRGRLSLAMGRARSLRTFFTTGGCPFRARRIDGRQRACDRRKR